jgi:regulator of sigma E protease
MVLVLVHEMGHFFVARWCGMRVERFSIFFGKPLIHWTRGETQYRLGWLPLGGYVKISGMTPDEVTPAAVFGRTYAQSAPWRKIATIAAGPAVNVVVGVACLTLAFWVGVPQQIGQSNLVESVTVKSVASDAGLRPGDRMLSVNGVGPRDNPKVADPRALDLEAMREQITNNADKPVTIVYERDGLTVTREVTPKRERDDGKDVGRIGFGFGSVSRTVQSSPLGGLRESVDQSWFFVRENVKAIGRLFTSSKAREQTGTVVRIGADFNDVARRGIGSLIAFAGLISLLLALYNLIPLLPLDGGHILSAIVEKIRGRPLSRRAMEGSAVVGLLLIGLLFFTAVRNDVLHFTGRNP